MRIKDNHDLQKVIKKIIIDKGLKQGYIADSLGLSNANFSYYLNRKNLTFDDFIKIFDAMGYDVDISLIPKDNKKLL